MSRLSTLVLLSALASAALPARPARALPIRNDDYPRARTEARRRGVPLFVEVWAPW